MTLKLNRKITLLIGTVLFVAAGCVHSSEKADSLNIFVASSLTDVFGELSDAFDGDNPSVINSASSSSLVQQINGGAPVQILATANDLVLKELDSTYEARFFGMSELVIAVPQNNPKDITSLADLENKSLLLGQCIRSAPCGNLAEKVIQHSGLAISLDSYERSAKSTLSKLILGELDAALIYKVDVVANNTNKKNKQLLAIELSDIPLELRQNSYYIVELNPPASLRSKAFIDFLFTPTAKEILTNAGFMINN